MQGTYFPINEQTKAKSQSELQLMSMNERESATSFSNRFLTKMSDCQENNCDPHSSNILVDLFLTGIPITHLDYAPLRTMFQTQRSQEKNLDIHNVRAEFMKIDDSIEVQRFSELRPNGRAGRRYENAYTITTTTNVIRKFPKRAKRVADKYDPTKYCPTCKKTGHICDPTNKRSASNNFQRRRNDQQHKNSYQHKGLNSSKKSPFLKGVTCNYCGIEGHLGRDCHKKKRDQENGDTDSQRTEQANFAHSEEMTHDQVMEEEINMAILMPSS